MKLPFSSLLAPLLFNLSPARLLPSPGSQTVLLPSLQQQFALKSAPLLLSTDTVKLHDDYGPVPGNSPVRYNGNNSTSLFAIDTLDMHPNPCVMYVAVNRCIHRPLCWPLHPNSLILYTASTTLFLPSVAAQEPPTPAPYVNYIH